MPVDTRSYDLLGQPEQSSVSDAFQRAFASAQQRRGQEENRRGLDEQRRAKLAEDARKQEESDQFKRAMAATVGMSREDALTYFQQHTPGEFLSVQKAYGTFDDQVATTKKALAEAESSHALAVKHQHDVIGLVADHMAQSDFNPIVVNQGLDELGRQFEDWKPHIEELRKIASTQGKEAFASAIRPYVPSDITKQRADVATTAAELPGKRADAERLAKVNAGTSPQGITAEQQAQNTHAAGQLAVSRGQLGVAQAREKRDADVSRQSDALLGVGGPTGPSAARPHGQRDDAYLTTLPTLLADKVKALADGRLQMPTRFAKGDTYWQSILDAVSRYDPSFDAGNYNARNKARSDFTSQNSAGGKSIGNLNVAISHLGELSKMADGLKNRDVQMYNTAANALMTATGWTGKTNFDTVAPKLADEIERLWRGSGGSEGSIDRTLKSLNSSMSGPQLQQAIAESAKLIEGKLSTIEQQRDTVLGPAGQDIPIIHPKSQALLDKLSGAPAANAPVKHAVGDLVTVNGQTVRVTKMLPDGRYEGEVVK